MTKRKRNFIRVSLDVVLCVPGDRIAPLEHVSLTGALVVGLRELGVIVVGAATPGKRKLQWVDECIARRGSL